MVRMYNAYKSAYIRTRQVPMVRMYNAYSFYATNCPELTGGGTIVYRTLRIGGWRSDSLSNLFGFCPKRYTCSLALCHDSMI